MNARAVAVVAATVTRERVREEELPRLESELLQKMHELLRIRPAVTWLAPNTLERTAKKTQLLGKAYES